MAKLAGSMKKYEECQDDELIRRLRDGDGSVMDYLMEKYKDLVRRKARLMYLPGADQEDLIQEGMIGLFKAVRDYEKDRDASFSTFADLCISRQIYTAVEAGARKKHAPLNHYVSLSQPEDRDEDKQAYEPEDVWEKSPEELVNEVLIPALDTVGAGFEKGVLFLPQLLQSAGAAQAAFEVVKDAIAASGKKSGGKGKIIVATVKGDIHDIGKNIVKTLLENYGYDVLDLGRDVPAETVVKAAQEHGVRLVGLSALMTTTLGSMEETICALRRAGLSCRVMVGGAVLTPEYAMHIGADYYAKDAKQSVDIAREVLG